MSADVATAMTERALPPPDRAAFLLDFDGTLVDIAETPDGVVVPPELTATLSSLRTLCGDALAIVTGRPLDFVDARLPGIPYAIAAEHGGVLRHAPDDAASLSGTPPPEDWLDRAASLVARHPGALLERKLGGFAVHYRRAPAAGEATRAALAAMVAERPEAFALLEAKMAWEVRPVGFDKGTSVTALMRRPPFAGRLPVFVGDDVTDRDGIAAATRLGGVGLMVPEIFGDAGGVRDWLARLARTRPGAMRWDV